METQLLTGRRAVLTGFAATAVTAPFARTVQAAETRSWDTILAAARGWRRRCPFR